MASRVNKKNVFYKDGITKSPVGAAKFTRHVTQSTASIIKEQAHRQRPAPGKGNNLAKQPTSAPGKGNSQAPRPTVASGKTDKGGGSPVAKKPSSTPPKPTQRAFSKGPASGKFAYEAPKQGLGVTTGKTTGTSATQANRGGRKSHNGGLFGMLKRKLGK